MNNSPDNKKPVFVTFRCGNSSVKMENIHFEENEFKNWLTNTDYKGPISLTVKFYVKPDQVEKFREVMKGMIEYSYADHGALMYKLHVDYKDPTIFWLTEQWKSVADLKHHATDEKHEKTAKMLGGTLRSTLHVGLYQPL